MKKIMMIGLVSLTLLGGQAVLPQGSASNNQSTAVARPVITGFMKRDFVKRIDRRPGIGRLKREGRREFSDRIDTFNNTNVQYDEQARQWNIFAQVRDSKWNRRKKSWDMWVKYNEETGVLIISTTKENRNQWTLKKNPNIKVTIADDRSTFRIDFLANFEGTNDAGYNYNWMTGSWLLVTR
jgi:hypothetical protein